MVLSLSFASRFRNMPVIESNIEVIGWYASTGTPASATKLQGNLILVLPDEVLNLRGKTKVQQALQ